MFIRREHKNFDTTNIGREIYSNYLDKEFDEDMGSEEIYDDEVA